MYRFMFLLVVGVFFAPQLATAQDQTDLQDAVSYDYHVIGDVQSPGSHSSTMEKEWLVHLLKEARLFPADNYRLRLVRDGKVQWEANVRNDKPTPSVQLTANDVLIVESQTATAKGFVPTATDPTEVAFVVAGKKTEVKSVPSGMSFSRLSHPAEFGTLRSIVPANGAPVIREPEQRELQDGDILVFAERVIQQRPVQQPIVQQPNFQRPNVQQPVLGGPAYQPTQQQQSAPQNRLSGGTSVSMPNLNSNHPPRSMDIVGRMSSPNLSATPTSNGGTTFPAIVPASQSRLIPQIHSGSSQPTEMTIDEQIAAAKADLLADRQQSVNHGLTDVTSVFPSLNSENPPLLAADATPSLDSAGPAEPVEVFEPIEEITTSVDQIRTAMQDEINSIKESVDVSIPQLEFDSDNELQFDAQSVTNHLNGATTSLRESTGSMVSDVKDQTSAAVAGAKKSASEFADSISGKLTQNFDAGLTDDVDDEATRRKYSSVLFVLLLLGSITSLFFIWSKNNDRKMETQFETMRKYGTGVVEKATASGAAAVAHASSAVSNAVDSVGESFGAGDVGGQVNSTTAAMMAVGESRLDRLIHDRLEVSHEANHIQSTFELNAEPLGPRQYRIDSPASPMQKGPHFRMPAASPAQSTANDVQSQSTGSVRVDGADSTTARRHFTELPEGRLDRALNSIKAVE